MTGRTEHGATTLDFYEGITGSGGSDAIADLLADLMHYCDRTHFDFDAALSLARGHFNHEKETDR